MDTDKFLIVDYSDKAFAVPGERDTCLIDEYNMIGGRFNSHLKFGAGWIFSKKKCLDRVKHMFTAYQIEFASVELSDIVSDDDKTDNNGTRTGSGKLPEYIRTDKNTVIVTLADGGTFTIGDNKLKTEFWFGYSDLGQGPTNDECNAAADNARSNEQYFINENLSELQNRVAWLQGDTGGRACKYPWLLGDDCGAWSLDSSNIDPETTNAVDCLSAWERNKYNQGLYKPLGDTNRERLIAGYNHAIALREKRCRAYLKRYGLSKIRVSTYWMDR